MATREVINFTRFKKTLKLVRQTPEIGSNCTGEEQHAVETLSLGSSAGTASEDEGHGGATTSALRREEDVYDTIKWIGSNTTAIIAR